MTGMSASRAEATASMQPRTARSMSGRPRPMAGSDPWGWQKPFCMSTTISAWVIAILLFGRRIGGSGFDAGVGQRDGDGRAHLEAGAATEGHRHPGARLAGVVARALGRAAQRADVAAVIAAGGHVGDLEALRAAGAAELGDAGRQLAAPGDVPSP